MANTDQRHAPAERAPTIQTDRNKTNAHLVGGGIASLASAAYLIRDGGMPGNNIHIYEETNMPGGSLDGKRPLFLSWPFANGF